jgi:hypothetical protein
MINESNNVSNNLLNGNLEALANNGDETLPLKDIVSNDNSMV